MKKFILVAVVVIFTVLSFGCDSGPIPYKNPNPVIKASDNQVVSDYQFYMDTLCYDGVVYVSFKYNSGAYRWGSAKFGRDSKVVTCSK